MSYLVINHGTPVPVFRERDDVDRAAPADVGRRSRPSRMRALLEALADAGAFTDPSGALAVQRLRGIQRKESQDGR